MREMMIGSIQSTRKEERRKTTEHGKCHTNIPIGPIANIVDQNARHNTYGHDYDPSNGVSRQRIVVAHRGGRKRV